VWPNTVARNRTVFGVKSCSALGRSSQANAAWLSLISLSMSLKWEHRDKTPKARAGTYRWSMICMLSVVMATAEVDASAFKRHINIFADNQAAIHSLTRPEGRSGVYILKQIVPRAESFQEKGHIVVVR
jgi:hypothetical protein